MKNKYCVILNDFDYQVFDFETKKVTGIVKMLSGEIGRQISDTELSLYEFDNRGGVANKAVDIGGGQWRYPKVHIPVMVPLCILKNKGCKLRDGLTDIFHDDHHKKNVENYEKRIFTAKEKWQLDIAKFYFLAAEVDRLEIKQSMKRINETISTTHN